MLHIYIGNGKGKTTAAVGLAVRMSGYNRNILFIQFLKGGASGEVSALKKCGVKVMRCNRQYPFSGAMTENDRTEITACHNGNLKFAKEHLKEYDMIVFDEIFDALNLRLADKDLAMEIIKNADSTELVMTGHAAEECFLDNAGYVTEMKKIKHVFDTGVSAREGIEF